MADLIGQQFGDYRLTRLLGQGGFANVYLGEHIHLETPAAIKILHERLIAKNLESFRQEARTIARLKHPHIVHVFSFGIDATGIPFLVMDYLPAGSIRTIHPQGQKVPLERVILYTRQVAQALQYAHDAKIIHRDVKPQNLLLGPNQEVILSDFGIAVVAHHTASMEMQSVIGTALYMAPEQSRGYPTLASDQYSLGILVYEWLCGECPFQGASLFEIGMKHATEPVPSLRQKVPTLLPEIEQAVLTALAKDPKERFSSVQAFANALEQACELEPNQSGTFVSPVPSLPTFERAVPPPLPDTKSASDISSGPTTHPPGQLPAQEIFPLPPTANIVQIDAKNIVCPECGMKDRIEKVSALAIKDTSVLSQLVSFLEPKKWNINQHPWFIVLLFLTWSLIVCSPIGVIGFFDHIGSGPFSLLTLLIIGLPGGIGLLIWTVIRMKRLKRAFEKETGSRRARAYALWDRLYYCFRNDVVFVPGSPNQRIRPREMRKMILQEYVIPKQHQHRRSPAVVGRLILFILVLIGGTGIGIYGVTTGIWPWGSIPGRIWHMQTIGYNDLTGGYNDLTGVAWSGSQFVVVGGSGTILTSPDGRTWTSQDPGTLNDLTGVAWSGHRFVAVRGSSTLLTSPDGHTWTSQKTGTSNDLTGVAWSGSQFVAVGGSGTLLTSSDGRTWTSQKTGTSNDLTGVAWSGSQFVVAGGSGTLLTSPDGRTWTPQDSGIWPYYISSDFTLTSVVWADSQFVVVGGSGAILTSPDGRAWTSQDPGGGIVTPRIVNDLTSVVWADSQFVVVGGSGTILTSPDGRTWTSQDPGTSNNLTDVAWSGHQIVVVGDSGTLLTSP